MARAPLKFPVTSSTQHHLDLEDIKDDFVILKDGGVALILETTAVNFGLLSETEQDAAIYAYAGLLNSLTFPIQIVIRNRQLDISSYVQLLKEQETKQTNDNLRFQMSRYRQFIESIIRENNVLDKRFYIIIPFSPLELGAPSAAFSLLGMLNPFSRKRGGLPHPKDYILEKAKNALLPKKDHITKQLARIGLRAQRLNTQELVELFYDIYNPTQISSQKITASTSDYTTPLVTPAVEGEEETQIEKKAPQPPSLSEPQALPEAPGQTPAETADSSPKTSLPSQPPEKSQTSPSAPPPATTPSPTPPRPVPPTDQPQSSQTTPPLNKQPPSSSVDKEPRWLKKVQEKVNQDQQPASSPTNKDSMPRLARVQPQVQPLTEPKVIGGRVATPPGQVIEQVQPKSPSPQQAPTKPVSIPRPPSQTAKTSDLFKAGGKVEKTLFQS